MKEGKDRFDLEDDIMKCWNVTEDLDMVLERVLDSPKFKNMPPELADKIANLLIGMKELYEMRFERLWETFESMIKDRKLDYYYDEYTQMDKDIKDRF
jgi:hypothetical protein